ncbi:hypothetical protein Tco_0564598 [Tanacetum coccineum]
MKSIPLSLLMSTQGTLRNSILVNFYDEKGSVYSKQYWTEVVATTCYTQNRTQVDYVPESDPEEEPEEDDEDPEEDPADYPADGDDDDDEDEDEDEEEEEEHPAPADFVPPVHRMTARISIRDEPSISLPPREEVERLLALTTPPPSPLTPLSSPLPQIPSPTPNSPTHIEIPESCLPLRKRVRFASPTPSREVGESSAAGAARQDRPTISRDDPYSIAREDLYGFVDMVDVPPRCSTSRELDYDITDTWDDLVGAIDEIAPTTVEGVNQRVTDLATIVEEETTSMYGIMEDAQDDRSQLRGRVNMLYRDRPVHRRLAVMIEREAKMAREAWGLSMDASDYARSDVMSLRTTVVAQSALISELQSADHRRQRVITELLASDHKRQVQLTKTLRLLKGLQTQMVELQRQHGPAEGPSQPDAPGEARTPPLLPIPLPAPSTSRRADIPEADTPPRKRLLLTTPRPGCEVGESSAAAAARQPGPTMAHRVDYSLVDTMETRFRDTERRMMTALEMVNMRVSYQVDVRSRESSEFYSRHHDAQKDRAAVRAEIEVLRRERLAYEQESMETRQALARSEAYCRALEARVTVLETEVRRHEWQRQAADDFAVRHIMRTQALEAGARVDTLEDTGSSS